jgi:acetylornithine deacetylase/succinyl-diaminopimelate desuccinylase-like protein
MRTLPGQEERVLAEIQRIVGEDIVVEVSHRDIGLEVPFAGARGRDGRGPRAPRPGRPRSAVSHGRRDRQQGARRARHRRIRFAPLRLPTDLDFTGMFHGVDERVPIDALVFGQRVLTDLIRTY